jgi:hypothetical protein
MMAACGMQVCAGHFGRGTPVQCRFRFFPFVAFLNPCDGHAARLSAAKEMDSA